MDKSKLFQKFFLLTGRVDACEKIVIDLQGKIERDQAQIELIKQQLKEDPAAVGG